MMSNGTFPQRFTKVDDLTRADHWYLTENDACYFIGEYTARMGFSYSTTNDLVLNFKKTMDRRGTPEWRYKERAIDQAAVAFRTALGPNGIDALTFVPMPPSKAKGDPLYDDRLIRLLNAIRSHPPLDVRELIIQIGSTEAVHGMEDRPKPHQIEALYRIDEELAAGLKPCVAIIDDVLTTGAHFRAAKSVLSARFPEQEFIGLFLARRTPESSDL